eukprot:c9983_g3_i1.p1 GENE.c9983_g3_i1~~c9983_g3_i1.p1  ORF type:complete len:661 (-),score=152.20 c9983_g3_i1:227-1981(-)
MGMLFIWIMFGLVLLLLSVINILVTDIALPFSPVTVAPTERLSYLTTNLVHVSIMPIFILIISSLFGIRMRFVKGFGVVLTTFGTITLGRALMFLNPKDLLGSLVTIGYLAVVNAALLFFVHTHEAMRCEIIKATNEWMIREAQLNEQKNQAIAYIFHEVRNPVNAINMAAEIAIDMANSLEPQKPELHGLIGDILTAADMAVRVLNDVLDLDRLRAGTFEFAPAPFNLVEMHVQVMRVLQHQMALKGIHFTSVIDTSLRDLFVVGDAQRLKQVLQNFLTNAQKFTPHGGCVTVTVKICDSEPRVNDHVRIRTAVTDTGVGISEEDRHRLFQPWSQIRSGDQQHGQGSGLGLALSKQLIELGHNGLIDFESSAGSGSTFFFEITFPIAPSVPLTTLSIQPTFGSQRYLKLERGERDSENAEEIANDPAEPIRSYEAAEEMLFDVDVMIVDDSAMTRALMVRTLTLLDLTSLACENGSEAVEKLLGSNRIKCRLVVMDKEMPVMDGYVATQTLRQNGYRGYIVGLTGNALDEQVSEFLSQGVDEVITKPIKRERIVNMLRQYGVLTENPSNDLLFSPKPEEALAL